MNTSGRLLLMDWMYLFLTLLSCEIVKEILIAKRNTEYVESSFLTLIKFLLLLLSLHF